MNNETGGVSIEEFVGLKRCSFMVDNRNKHKKVKDVNKIVVTTISHGEYNYVLLNIKCLRHLMNKIQSKNRKMGTYEIHKISLSCFDDKIIS